MGRPSIFSEDYADDICAWIASGKSLTSWCEPADRPGYSTVMAWLPKNPNFQENYTRARDMQGENTADQIADVRAKIESGALSPEQGRVMISSLQWESGRRAPKRYGERMDVAVSGEIGIGEALAQARARGKPEQE